jgi:hypothetical protein
MVLKQLSVYGLALVSSGFAQTLSDKLADANERMLSKNGLEIHGDVESEYFHSGLDGSAVDKKRYAYETTQFTAIDLDMRYRAYDFVGARAVVRFQQDWQTFFATRSRIVGARWLSMDGNIANMLSFNAGDFRQKYTPLTLWAPELDLVYEPEIFSDARQRLMDEQFLGDNNRPLQGLNLDFAKRFQSPLTEIRVDGIGSRIRRSEYLDPNGWQGHRWVADRNGDGRMDNLSLATADMDRYFLAGNAEALVMDNLAVGGTYQALIDDRHSYQPIIFGTLRPSVPQNYLDSTSLNRQDSVIASDLRVAAGHGGIDLAGFIGSKTLILELLGEYAMSSEASAYAWHYTRNGGTLHDTTVSIPGRDGTALNLHLDAGYASDGSFGFKLEADYLNNEAAFQNPLAQTPTFVATRVMNTENDSAAGRLYSTFDALNNGVYKFTPSDTTELYQLDPFTKTSYNNGTYTSQELSSFTGDPVVQLMLPMGMATPNRTGFKARLNAGWKDAIHLIVDYSGLKELKGAAIDSITAEPVKFTQVGGGAKVELNKLLGWSKAVNFSGSYTQTKAERRALPSESASPNITVDLIQAGFNWRIFSKWAVLGGFQQAVLQSPTRLDSASVHNLYNAKETQRHFRVGVEYNLGKHSYFLISGGLLDLDRKLTHKGTEAGGPPNPGKNSGSDFSQLLSQALVKVRF